MGVNEAGTENRRFFAIASLGRNHWYWVVGLADDDPLLAVTRQCLHVTYRSDLFALSWSDELVTLLDGGGAYIEIATL